MSLNRFYLTQDGWVPEGLASPEAASWSELIATDVLTGAMLTLDENAVSPPLAVMAWKDPPPLFHADVMAEVVSAMTSLAATSLASQRIPLPAR